MLRSNQIAKERRTGGLTGLEVQIPTRPLRIPQVLKGAAAGCRALERWSFQYFAATYGQCSVEVALTPNRLVLDEVGARVPRVTMQLSKYIAQLPNECEPDGSRYYYLSKCNVEDLDAALMQDLDPTVVSGSGGDRVTNSLWLSPKGAITPLHWDLPDNSFVQVVGRKRWRIYAPGARRTFYPHRRLSHGRHISRVDAARPDWARFPDFPSCPDIDVVLAPGDVLLLPSGWWHHVESLDLSISFNSWSLPRLRGYRPDILVGDLCADVAITIRRRLAQLYR